MEAVLFDMDGVIVNSEEYWEEEKPEIFREAGVPESFSHQDLTGMNETDQYHHLQGNFDLNVDAEGFFQLYDRKANAIYQEKVELLPGLKETLNDLDKKGLKTGLVSSSVESWINKVIDRFNLEKDFDIILSAEKIESESKPNPQIYLIAADKLGVEPENCLVIEDSENGVEAAKSAGMYCIGLDGGKGQNLSKADEVIKDREKLCRRIKEIT
jgi:HAD superfamily hydrolase (TIGR01509 family)